MRTLITRNHVIHFLIFMCSLNLFIWGIDRTPYRVADENRYVPAALEYIQNGVRWNWSHPPLGEMIIATGISIFGDNALGWRFMSVFFGALALNAMFALAMVLFRSERAALEVTAICLLNQMLFVQSRVATLDIFMFSFMAWGLVYFFKFQRDEKNKNLLVAGAFFGLAVACKWFALIPATFCFSYYLYHSPKSWKEKGKEVSIYLVGVPLAIYLLAFSFTLGMHLPKWAPKVGESVDNTYGTLNFFALQFNMLKNQMAFGNPAHEFASPWYTWPVSIKQFWYERNLVEIDGQRILHAIVLFGNPFVLWFGFGSIFLSIFEWIKKKNDLGKVISLLFLTLFLSWAIIPRRTTFFYYYFPAAMILSLSLVFMFEQLRVPRWARILFLVLCLLNFLFFYPALASVEISIESSLYKLIMS